MKQDSLYGIVQQARAFCCWLPTASRGWICIGSEDSEWKARLFLDNNCGKGVGKVFRRGVIPPTLYTPSQTTQQAPGASNTSSPIPDPLKPVPLPRASQKRLDDDAIPDEDEEEDNYTPHHHQWRPGTRIVYKMK